MNLLDESEKLSMANQINTRTNNNTNKIQVHVGELIHQVQLGSVTPVELDG